MNRAERQASHYAAARRLAASLPWADLPFLTCALPAAGSLGMLFAAGFAILAPRNVGLAVPLLWMQALLLAVAANRIAAVAHERLLPWERRAAPVGARERVRAWLLQRLWQLGGLGMVGPLALGVVQDSHVGELRMLPGVAALLAASLGGGLVLGLSWRGRAPRALALPAVLLLVQLLQPGGIEAVGRGDLLASLGVLVGAGLLLCSLLPAVALAAVAPPLPRLGPPAWLRRSLGRLFMVGWGRVPHRIGAVEIGSHNSLSMLTPILAFTFAARTNWWTWARPFDDAWTVGGYGLALFIFGLTAMGSLVAPPLHWRLRLAPETLTSQRWARGLVLGSMLAYAVPLSLSVGVVTVVAERGFPLADAGLLASGLGDLLLVFSIAAWLRGRSLSPWDSLSVLLGLSLAAIAVLAGLNGLGFTPQRGWAWLSVQLVVTALFTRLAVRAWARQDLNVMTESIVWAIAAQPNHAGAPNR